MLQHKAKPRTKCVYSALVYSKTCQTSKMEYFEQIVNGFQSLIIFTKSPILDNRKGSKYASVH